jgi:DNA topoisomerase-3
MRYSSFQILWSELAFRQIHRAAQHPIELDQAQADAVQARIVLDLRVGAAFTRMQTLSLQPQFQALEDKVLSYGT